MTRPDRDAVVHRMDERFEMPDRQGFACVPGLVVDLGTVQLRRMVPGTHGETSVLWNRVVEIDDARDVYDWMCARPESWHLWGRLVHLFGDDVLRVIVIDTARQAIEQCLRIAEEDRLADEERVRLRDLIELFILDQKDGRPGLSLQSGDEKRPFFRMHFSERWERERVLDWIRWQRDRYLGFRDVVSAKGSIALERLILAGMRDTERDVRTRGMASGGRRPLRFWRGE